MTDGPTNFVKEPFSVRQGGPVANGKDAKLCLIHVTIIMKLFFNFEPNVC